MLYICTSPHRFPRDSPSKAQKSRGLEDGQDSGFGPTPTRPNKQLGEEIVRKRGRNIDWEPELQVVGRDLV